MVVVASLSPFSGISSDLDSVHRLNGVLIVFPRVLTDQIISVRGVLNCLHILKS